MFYRLHAVISLCLIFSSSMGLASGRELVASGHLTQEAYNTLVEANQSKGYKIKLLKKGENENLQLVVFAGEYHVKTERDSLLGKALLAHFKVRGLEGLNSASSCFTAGLSKLVGPIYKCLRSSTKEEYGSTTHDAQLESGLLDVTGVKRVVSLYERDLTELVNGPFIIRSQGSEITLSIDELPDEMRKNRSYDVYVPDHQKALRIQNISLQELFENRKNIHSYFQWDTQKPTNFWLETNHRNSAGETVGSLYFPLSLGVCTAAAFSLIPYTDSIIPNTATIALQSSAAALVLHAGIASQIEKKYQLDWLLPTALYPINGLVYGRNQTMASNLSRILMDFPEIHSILVIVGMKHVSGMAQILIDNHGFETVDLD